MKILDLNIDFPKVAGYSDRQVWYAEQLREKYISDNEDRFREIEEISNLSNDKRNLDYLDEELLETYNLEFSEIERIVLFTTSAGLLIKTLKEKTHGRNDFNGLN